jgi:hypothetical protein
MGVRAVVSTWAFLDGLASRDGVKTLLCVDIEDCPKVNDAIELGRSAGVSVAFIKGDSAKTPIGTPELLFIDTFHVYAHLRRELAFHAPSVGRYIIMHDTTVDADKGEAIRQKMDVEKIAHRTGYEPSEIKRGLWPAIEEFLASNKDWTLERRWTNNNGLTVLARVQPRYGDPALDRFRMESRSAGMRDFGVIILRCVRDAEHDLYWQECLACVRRVYGPYTDVIIVDDGSDPTLLSLDPADANTKIITIGPELRGRAEYLPLLIMWRDRPFRRALILHDTMFVQNAIPADSTRFHFTIPSTLYREAHEADVYKLLSALRGDTSALKALYADPALWHAWFGAAGVVTLNDIDTMHNAFGFFDSRVSDTITSRNMRSALERVAALVCFTTGVVRLSNCSNFGVFTNGYVEHGKNSTWESYTGAVESVKRSWSSIVKIFTGR